MRYKKISGYRRRKWYSRPAAYQKKKSRSAYSMNRSFKKFSRYNSKV